MKKYKLSELIEIKNGKDHKDLPNGKYPVFGSGGIMRYVNSYLYDKPSVLLPRKGTLSNIQYCDTPFWTVDTLYYTEVNEELVSPYYLYRYLRLLDMSRLDTGTGVPSMTFDSYNNIEVFLPNIEGQRRVASILQKLDAKIALNRRINDNLEAMAKQLYDYWFVQFDFPNEEGKPYKSSGGAMVWNEKLKRDIPQGWSDCKLKDFINLFDSKRIPLSSKDRGERQGIYPYYGATGIMDYVNDYIFDGDYILLAEDGSTSDGKGFPIVQYIWGKNWVNNHAHIILPKNEQYTMFTYQMLRSIPAKQIETGSIQKKISQENLCGHKMALPNSDLMEKYDKIIFPLWEKRKRCIEEINTLIKQRDELLPLLMNGQASVNYHLSARVSISFDMFVMFLNFTNCNLHIDVIDADYQRFVLPLRSKENTHGTIQDDKRHIQQRQRQGDEQERKRFLAFFYDYNATYNQAAICCAWCCGSYQGERVS